MSLSIIRCKINEKEKKSEIDKIKNENTKSADCSTPVDCYAKAIDALNLAKQTYYNAVDKIESIQNTLINYMDEKVKNSTVELKVYTESIRNDLINKINSVQDFSNSKYNDINYSQHNHVCRDLYTNCADDGGGNFVYSDRHFPECGVNEFMKSWQWIRCNSNSIRVHYICCRNP